MTDTARRTRGARTRPALSVRRATSADLDVIIPLRAAQRREDPSSLREPTLDDDGAELIALTRRQLGDTGQLWLLAERDAPCGLLRCAIIRRDDTAPYAVLTTAYVVPQARRDGVLRQLVEHATTWAAAQGVTEVRLRTNAPNAAAAAAWGALGFTPAIVTWRRSGA